MDDSQLLRYSRHILLRQVDIAGQGKLLHARVLIIGLGGLGSPVAMYLGPAASGSLSSWTTTRSNLPTCNARLCTRRRPSASKAASAAKQLRHSIPASPLPPSTASSARRNCWNRCAPRMPWWTRATTSHAFRRQHRVREGEKPLVSAVVRFEGQVAVFRPDLPDSPCYRCLYAESNEPERTLRRVWRARLARLASSAASRRLKRLNCCSASVRRSPAAYCCSTCSRWSGANSAAQGSGLSGVPRSMNPVTLPRPIVTRSCIRRSR